MLVLLLLLLLPLLFNQTSTLKCGEDKQTRLTSTGTQQSVMEIIKLMKCCLLFQQMFQCIERHTGSIMNSNGIPPHTNQHHHNRLGDDSTMMSVTIATLQANGIIISKQLFH